MRKFAIYESKFKNTLTISYYRKQKIMLLARLNLNLASEDQEEIDLYKHYQKDMLPEEKEE